MRKLLFLLLTVGLVTILLVTSRHFRDKWTSKRSPRMTSLTLQSSWVLTQQIMEGDCLSLGSRFR